MSNLEQTLIVVKPDGFKKGLVGKIISRFEEKGFQIVNLRSFQFDTDTARKFYDAHKDKHFFNELVSFICSGKTVGCIFGRKQCNFNNKVNGWKHQFYRSPTGDNQG